MKLQHTEVVAEYVGCSEGVSYFLSDLARITLTTYNLPNFEISRYTLGSYKLELSDLQTKF